MVALDFSVSFPDPTPKRGKGSGTLRAFSWSCAPPLYHSVVRYYAINSHMHVYTNISGQYKSHDQIEDLQSDW